MSSVSIKDIFMLSYRHAFHAGNHADILKHYTISLVLDYYNKKEKPYCVIDTHAGAGLYKLHDEFSQKNKEYMSGISRLFSAKDLPISITKFIEIIQTFNTKKALNIYPGSPKIAEYFMREHDQLRLFELHPNDFKHLKNNFQHTTAKHIQVEMHDGFKGLIASLPPTTKRGVIIIDPPYEAKHDYQRVTQTIEQALKRFATGCYIIWYPLLQRSEPAAMVESLRSLSLNNWLNVTLQVMKPSVEGIGMYGSGLYIINPPWILAKMLEESMPYFKRLLGDEEGASVSLAFESK